MTDPTMLSQDACDAELTARFPDFRRQCGIFALSTAEQIAANRNDWTWLTDTRFQDHAKEHEEQPGMLTCHGFGYVSAVTTGPLIEALYAAGFALGDIFEPQGEDRDWDVWLFLGRTPSRKAYEGIGSTFDLALRRAAVVAIREEKSDADSN